MVSTTSHKGAGGGLLLDRSGEQGRRASQRVIKGDFFAEAQLLIYIDTAEAGHKRVFSNVDTHDVFERDSRMRNSGHERSGKEEEIS